MLHEKRLKAQSKADYAGRLTLLFLLYKYNSGEKYIDRDILNSFISAQHLYDGNYRKWLSRNKAMIDISNGKCSLCQAGIEKLKNIYLKFLMITLHVNGHPENHLQLPIQTLIRLTRKEFITLLKI